MVRAVGEKDDVSSRSLNRVEKGDMRVREISRQETIECLKRQTLEKL